MQTLLLETMVRTQLATLKMPLMEGRTLSRKKKNDYTKTLGDWTEMQCDTPRALQVRDRKHKRQPLSETSHAPRDFFGFVALPSFRRTQASTDMK
jgi:hypothetical protein